MNLRECFLIIIITSQFLMACSQNKESFTNEVTICQSNGQWCESIISQQRIAILFPKKVPYLKPFIVQVKFVKNDQIKIQQANIKFSMQEMDMGVNTFTLKLTTTTTDDQQWQTKAILPICSTGSKKWVVQLSITIENKIYNHNFIITVN
jgi:hypothetical protein